MDPMSSFQPGGTGLLQFFLRLKRIIKTANFQGGPDRHSREILSSMLRCKISGLLPRSL